MGFEIVRRHGLELVQCTGLQSRHAFSTRAGGVSEGAYGSLNLGLSSGDERERVLMNRERFRRAGGFTGPLHVCHQIHGAVVHQAPLEPGTQGDALVTDRPGVAIGVFVADCVPLLLEDRGTGAVAAVHSGWRGTAQRVVQATVTAMRERGTDPADLVAAIGPSIKGCCYRVGPEVVAALGSFPEPGAFMRSEEDRSFVDLQEANRQLLAEAGVGEVHVSGMCTHCDHEHFFSYRRDGARSGRMIGAIER